ncbi:putative transposase [Natronorubrum thiooxidans]|uniref:Putative transposase n=1 Tax=Natronorubrum thiooxidans TaxID=308853 RepID=A0A1N7H9S0_9EURY|nr:putative transposase [Natronorubrum thiooxidans]
MCLCYSLFNYAVARSSLLLTASLFDDDTVSLSTTASRTRCPLDLPEADDGYQRQYLDSDEWSVTESTLTAVMASSSSASASAGTRTIPNETPPSRTVLGVDFGVENFAVTSTTYFFSGLVVPHRLHEFDKVRAGLQ